MGQNFTDFAFSNAARELQEHYGSRKSYSRMENGPDRFVLTQQEVDFIQSRDSFYLSTVVENGWPYMQFRGGPVGFINVLDERTIGFADYKGNRQFISAGNIRDNGKAMLFMMDYPRRERVKIWATAKLVLADDDPELVARLTDPEMEHATERAVLFSIQAYDWNCPKYIPQKFTVEEIVNSPQLREEFRKILAQTE
ncbi:MAG: pyridoxamine 5'-phosphate oxidase family protein [Verrucomicrobiota bacterium]